MVDSLEYPTGPCASCRARPATLWYGHDERDVRTGNLRPWCKPCCLSAQIKHRRELAAGIPALEAELRALLDGTPPAEKEHRRLIAAWIAPRGGE